MLYGAYILNNRGQEIIYGNEVSYHYWGKRSVAFSSNGNEVSVSLFNIPASSKPIAFVRTSRSLLNAQVDVVVRGGKIFARCVCNDAGSFSVSATFYVFVSCQLVPLNPYGMAIWNNQSKLAYHSARPMLSSTLVSNKTQALSFQCAVSPVHMGQRIVQTATGSSIYDLCSNAVSNRIEENRNLLATMPPTGSELIKFNVQIAAINSSYYDGFSNLGNM